MKLGWDQIRWRGEMRMAIGFREEEIVEVRRGEKKRREYCR